jgi:hypothetical protein
LLDDHEIQCLQNYKVRVFRRCCDDRLSHAAGWADRLPAGVLPIWALAKRFCKDAIDFPPAHNLERVIAILGARPAITTMRAV